MSPAETFATGEIVKTLNEGGVTILAVEHDMSFVRQVARRVTVLHLGRIFAQGTIDEILADERVAALYLGQGHAYGKHALHPPNPLRLRGHAPVSTAPHD